MTEDFEVVYCPHHLGIHDSEWCTAGDHEGLGTTSTTKAVEEARRRGRTFYNGDVVNLRDSAKDPLVGDIVGDKRAVVRTIYGPEFSRAYLREVVEVDDERVTWKRPHKDLIYVCSRKSWGAWARKSWRCDPLGKPTRHRWSPP